MEVKSYRDLEVWRKSMSLVEEIYRLSSGLPRIEEFGLKIQMRRAAVSIPSNIAEGHSRRHSREFLQHLSISSGSLAELETQFDLAVRLNLIPASEAEEATRLCQEIGKMLHGLANAIRRQTH
jgi:four helix bundle protein